jgi:hypothetical protein
MADCTKKTLMNEALNLAPMPEASGQALNIPVLLYADMQ